MAFNIGERVQLKSGGPIMTITATGRNAAGTPQFTCSWFDANHTAQTMVYPAEALAAYRDEVPPRPADDE